MLDLTQKFTISCSILKGAKMESMELILSKRKLIHAASSATCCILSLLKNNNR